MGKGKELVRGQGACGGIVVTIVRVVNSDPEKMAQLKPGEAVVAERTTPKDEIYIKKASAIITDTGGILSHPGIIAREWGIPCIVGTMEGTTVLQDGQKVVVDGTEGGVYEYIPDEPVVTKPSLADKMAKLAAKKGIPLRTDFLEQMKRRE